MIDKCLIPDQSFNFKTAMKASCGTSTLPMAFIRFLPFACFFNSFFFLENVSQIDVRLDENTI